jgi:hypothetical protein
MEARFPGFPSFRWSRATSAAAGRTAGAVDDPTPKEDEKRLRKWKPAAQPSSGTRNFVIKFLLDQTVGSVLNIFLFIVFINLLKGASVRTTWDAVGKVCIQFERKRFDTLFPSLSLSLPLSEFPLDEYHWWCKYYIPFMLLIVAKRII